MCLRTSNLVEAGHRAERELNRMEREFAQKRQEITLSEASSVERVVKKLTPEQTDQLCAHWMRSVLQSDDARRRHGLTDNEFEELDSQLEARQSVHRRMLAQGKTSLALPLIQEYLLGCGLKYQPDDEEFRRNGYTFLQCLSETVDHQLKRQAGQVVDTDSVAPPVKHPLQVVFPELAPRDLDAPTWEKVFHSWQSHVVNRTKAAITSYTTPWAELQAIAESHRLTSPSDIRIEHLDELVERMKSRGLKARTVQQRIGKIRRIYKVAIDRRILRINPAVNVVCPTESRSDRRKRKRLEFDASNLQSIFDSDIFTKHLRPESQLGEASYWIPLLMFYTGARPEEIAGLAVHDVQHDQRAGWVLDMVDRHPGESDIDGVPETHRRTLKCDAAIRKVPVAQELIELGLLKYVQWVKDQGHPMLFPTLKKDCNGRLCGAMVKFFTRFKRGVGITDPHKVLYSFRHGMKNYLERALIPTKYLQRIVGHATGDGQITDGYGEDLPVEHVAEYFSRIQFQSLPALPWEPGKGVLKRKMAIKSRDTQEARRNDEPVLPRPNSSAPPLARMDLTRHQLHL